MWVKITWRHMTVSHDVIWCQVSMVVLFCVATYSKLEKMYLHLLPPTTTVSLWVTSCRSPGLWTGWRTGCSSSSVGVLMRVTTWHLGSAAVTRLLRWLEQMLLSLGRTMKALVLLTTTSLTVHRSGMQRSFTYTCTYVHNSHSLGIVASASTVWTSQHIRTFTGWNCTMFWGCFWWSRTNTFTMARSLLSWYTEL